MRGPVRQTGRPLRAWDERVDQRSSPGITALGGGVAALSELAAAIGLPLDAVTDVITGLAARGLTVATAESLTGGLLTALLTEVPGSSAVVRGGLVVYATDLKDRLAGVDPALLAERGPVDPAVAVALAKGARLRCGADVGIGLTGVAGPDPQDGQPVGTWFCAVSGPGEQHDERVGVPDDLGTRAQIRSAAVRAAVQMLANIAATDS
jgi:nicotinamide-nucleotide amidase